MTKLVGLMLATYTNKDGTKAHPGIERLVRDCGVGNEKTIRRHLLALIDLGLVERVFHGSSAGRRGLADEYVLTAPAEVAKGSPEAVPEPREAAENTGPSARSVDSAGPRTPDPGVQTPIHSTNPVLDHHADHLDLAHEPRNEDRSKLDPDDYVDEFDYLHDVLVAEVGALRPDEESTLFGMASSGCHPSAVEAKVRKMLRGRESSAVPTIPRQQVVAPWERDYPDEDNFVSSLNFVPDYDEPRQGRSYGDVMDYFFGNRPA